MAVSPDTSNKAFLREVDDEVRRERMIGFWQRWGLPIAAAVVIALIALAAFLFWRSHRQEVAARQGEQLQQAYDALGADDTNEAAKPLSMLSESDIAGYRTLARFGQADMLLKKNDLKGAAAKFAEVASDNNAGKPFRDLALVRQTAAEYDQLKPQVVVDRLRPLTVPGSPWFGSAGEMTAAAYLQLNRVDLATRLFRQISTDKDVPDSIRQRAVQMASVLEAQAGGTGKKASTK